MEFRYEQAHDAVQQLDGTVMLLDDGDPVFIKSFPMQADRDNNWKFQLTFLHDGATLVTDIRKIGLSFAPIQVGYINYKGRCDYAQRSAKRMWKAGLSLENLVMRGGGFMGNAVLKSKGLYDTINNIYPSINDAWTSAIHDGVSVAFHREFAFGFPTPDGGISLMWRGEGIGNVSEDRLLIKGKYHFLKQHVTEVFSGQA